jgi:hypothetical protein
MKIIRDKTGEYGDCAYEYLGFDRFSSDSKEEVMFYGYITPYSQQIKDQFQNFERKIFFQGEQPCGLYSVAPHILDQSLKVADYFDEVYSTCPYSAEWLNLVHGYDKYRPICFPHSTEHAVDEMHEKPVDVIYWGNVPNGSTTVLNILEAMTKFNSAFYTLGIGIPQRYHSLVTGVGTPRTQMWETLRKSKVMVTANLLYLTDQEVQAAKRCPMWEKNEAFNMLDYNIAPQIKTRPIEAIFNKTLVVLKEDPWRIFDKWFKAGEDFLYYKNDEDLEPLLREISNDWDSYKHIAENAYDKAMKNYTCKRTFEIVKNRELFDVR